MKGALRLSSSDRQHFMCALYSVFYRDKDINQVERDVLKIFNHHFDVSATDYKSYVHIKEDDIAAEINAIADVKIRIYFMRIIHDVYREEIKTWFNGPETSHAIKFRVMYNRLKGLVIVTESDTGRRSN